MTLDEFGRRLTQLGTGGLREVLRPVLIGACQLVENEVKLNRLTGQVLRSRTGRLRASVSATVEDREGAPALVARAGGTDGRGEVGYASIQEHGGVVVPRTAKMLRIPLGPALTAAGVDRFPTPLRQSAPGMFYLRRSKAGNLLLFHRETGIPWYVLKHSVTIPPRPYLRPGVEKVARDHVVPTLGRSVVRAIVTYGGGA